MPPDVPPLRWRALYREAELYKAALRVYTKPLFQWRKALSTSTDGRTLYDFAAHGLRSLDALHAALVRQTFAFRPALALHYNFNRKPRTIYLSPWEDRIVDLLLYRVLNQRLHGWFSPNSYAYRDRGHGLDVCQSRIARALRWPAPLTHNAPLYVVKRDITDYFASVNHDLLLAKVAELVAPDNFLFDLLEQRVRFVYVDNGEPRRAPVGIPFGTAVACLFANVFLTEFDRAIESTGVRYFRYGDDLLLIARERATAAAASRLLEQGLATLQLRSKPSHEANLVLTGRDEACLVFVDHSRRDVACNVSVGAYGDEACLVSTHGLESFTPVHDFRHLGLLFRAGGDVSLAREKSHKLQNLFRFAFRRRRRTWKKAATPVERARLLAGIAAETVESGVRNVAIFDYYLKHVNDERQLRRLDRWLAEEVLSLVFGGHKRGHFRQISFAELRALGLPSLVHRRRLLRSGRIASAFFIWRQERAARAFGRTAVRPRARAAFSPLPEAAAKASL